MELIETIRQRRHRGPRLQAATAASPEDESDDLVDGVMRAAAEWVTSRLARYRQFTGAGPVPELLGVLVACQKCLGEQSSIPEVSLTLSTFSLGRPQRFEQPFVLIRKLTFHNYGYVCLNF